MENRTHANPQTQGLAATAGAFGVWGFVVVFWHELGRFGSLELVFYRFVFSFLWLLLLIRMRGTWPLLVESMRDPKRVRLHLVNGILISTNWFAYVYAVTHEKVLEGSLAYFMVPILNTAMGYLILKERLTRLQLTAILCATVGVLNEIIQFGAVPWLALVMAGTFAIYGMNKTRSPLGPVTALAMETGLLLPLAMVGLLWMHLAGSATVSVTNGSDLLWMAATGLVTITPLLLFAFGAKRVQLTTIGVFQFIAPSIKFALGVFLYGEPFPPSKLITFLFIWTALGIYLLHLFRSRKRVG